MTTKISEALLEAVQDAILNDQIPFAHVTFMMDDGKILNSFSIDKGWSEGFLEVRFSPQGDITAHLTWSIKND